MQSHCGVYSQCVDRRFPTLASGIEEYDPADRYKVDIFRQDIPEGKDRTMATSYVRFANEVSELDGESIFERFGELYDRIDPSAPEAEEVAEALAALLKRHADAILKVMEDQLTEAKPEIVRQTLPTACLIRLIAGSGEPLT